MSRFDFRMRRNRSQTQAGRLAMRAYKSPALHAVARKMLIRQRVDGALDLLRLRLDTLPVGLYQPVSCLPVRTATRTQGCESRWTAIRAVVERVGAETAVDIGANAGYFSIELGSAGIPTIAIEPDPPAWRIAMMAVGRSGLDNVGVLALELRPDNMRMLPPGDCVLCLSIWHHLVRSHGLDGATGMLEAIWRHTRKVIFFDTGEEEMPTSFGLPDMSPEPRAWLTRYLDATCRGAVVEQLGQHAAFDAEGRPCERNLFAVIRKSALAGP